jgi:hypothetical protein
LLSISSTSLSLFTFLLHFLSASSSFSLSLLTLCFSPPFATTHPSSSTTLLLADCIHILVLFRRCGHIVLIAGETMGYCIPSLWSHRVDCRRDNGVLPIQNFALTQQHLDKVLIGSRHAIHHLLPTIRARAGEGNFRRKKDGVHHRPLGHARARTHTHEQVPSYIFLLSCAHEMYRQSSLAL